MIWPLSHCRIEVLQPRDACDNINVHMQSNAIAISLRVLQRWQRSIKNEATQLLEVAGVVT